MKSNEKRNAAEKTKANCLKRQKTKNRKRDAKQGMHHNISTLLDSHAVAVRGAKCKVVANDAICDLQHEAGRGKEKVAVQLRLARPGQKARAAAAALVCGCLRAPPSTDARRISS